jgi:hypothetical protein
MVTVAVLVVAGSFLVSTPRKAPSSCWPFDRILALSWNGAVAFTRPEMPKSLSLSLRRTSVRPADAGGRRPVMRIAPDDTAPTSGDGPAFAPFVENCVPKAGITCYDWDAGIPGGPRFDDVAGTEPIPTGQ